MDFKKPPHLDNQNPENSGDSEHRPQLPPNNNVNNPNHEDERIDRLRRAMYSRSLSKNIHERDRRELEPSQQLVGEDFKHVEEGVSKTSVAPKGILMARNVLQWLLIGSVLFFIGTMVFFGYYFFFGPGSTVAHPENIDIAISGPPQVAGGQASALQIVVTNRNNV